MPFKSNAENPRLIEVYQLHRSQMDRENDNLNQKIIWHVISQSFFFGAYTGLLNAPETAKNPMFGHQQDVLVWVLPWAALVLAVLILPSIIESAIEYWRIQKRFNEKSETEAEYLPPISKQPWLMAIGLVTPITIPLFITGVWITILLNQIGLFNTAT